MTNPALFMLLAVFWFIAAAFCLAGIWALGCGCIAMYKHWKEIINEKP